MSYKDILDLKSPWNKFLCNHSENNNYQIQFLSVRIRDIDTGEIFLEFKRPEANPEEMIIIDSQYTEEELKELDKQRIIHYEFSKRILYSKNIGFQIEFKVGNNPVKNFRIIDRLFFKDEILKEYTFTFPFCIPNTVNTWEIIYDIPKLDEEKILKILDNEWIVNSDSFYFVEDKLIIQNKAYYNYIEKN